jgi:hypothetical protein
MLKKIGRTGIVVALLAVIFLTIISLILLFESEVGMAKEIGIQEPPAYDRSAVPQGVIDDATAKAIDLVGKSQDKLDNMVDRLLATYAEAKSVDIVIFFNSGGWGWNLTQDTPGWASILDGVTGQLTELGYRSLILNYERTRRGVKPMVKEFFEAAMHYPHKAGDLAEQISFLTDNLPDLRVIIAGESTGTVISAKTMGILQDNAQVYSIQTGTPFWYQPQESDRTLLMNSNGRGIDTFSYGNIPAMVWATVKGWFGLTSPDDNPGDILSWLKAPGHHYSWYYPGVSSAVTTFLDSNFAPKN